MVITLNDLRESRRLLESIPQSERAYAIVEKFANFTAEMPDAEVYCDSAWVVVELYRLWVGEPKADEING